MTLKVLVADDDQPICNLISNILSEFEAFTVVAATTDSRKILGLVEQYQPDIVFLDISMPELDGLTVIHGLKREYPEICIVFVTGHAHFAAEAFNLDVVDYIVKPISKARIEKALQKIMRLKGMHINIGRNSGDEKKKLALKNGHGLIIVDISNILFIEKMGSKCIVHTNTGKYETSETISALEQKLSCHKFFRCHRSFLINMNQVEKVSPYADRAYEVTFYNYPLKANMRRDKFELFTLLMNI